ncbi:MAG: UvrD-helicase domain-containing protein [Bacilli bacterium]
MPTWTKEQQDAIEKDGSNIIVSAGAGSGKTAVLTERVIRKLKNGINIDELLILTFTKAAANEMKERIRKAIKDNKELIGQLEKIDSAYITTFDSFSLSLVKKYYYILNLTPNIKICETSILNLKKLEIIDKIFEQKYEEKNPYFLDLISTFCIKDDFEISSSILGIYNKLELILNKDEYLDNYIFNNYNELKINDDIEKYTNIIKKYIYNINANLEQLRILDYNEYYNKLEANLSNLILSKTYEEIKLNSKVEIPRLPSKSSDSLKQIKENIKESLEKISQLCLEDCDTLKNQYLKTKENVQIIIEILKEFDKKYKHFKQINDYFDFNDIASLGIKILKENIKVQQEIKNNFKEILVDEYQDTSDIQEEFISLISNNNVYMVGDIKQSIYRFRNANPYIFKNKYDKYKKHDNGIKIDLNKNFRSRNEVLEDINLIFNQIMDNNIGGAEYKVDHQMIFGNNTYINKGKIKENNHFQIYNYELNDDYKKEEIEAFITVSDIKQKINNHYQILDKETNNLRDIEYKDFVILMDRATNFDLYKKIFEYSGIPLSIYKDENLNSGEEFTLIKHLLKLLFKLDSYSFMSIARSYLFRFDDQYIFDIITNKKIKETDLYLKLSKIKQNIESKSITKILEQLIIEFDFYNKMITIGEIEKRIIRVENILNLSKTLGDVGYNIITFLEYLENIEISNQNIKVSLNNDEGNSVKIMTIHKSKGLEFPICYYTGLYAKFNISDIKEKFLFDNNYGIIVPIYDDGIRNTFYKELVKNDYLKEEISEKIRLFYVALTRAREKMILITSLTKKEQIFQENSTSCISYKSINFSKITLVNKLSKTQSKITNILSSNEILKLVKINYLSISRIKEKMKLIKKINSEVSYDLLSDEMRLTFKSFNDILILSKESLEKYIININLNKTNLTKNYNLNNLEKYAIQNETKKIETNELKCNETIIENASFSKKTNNLQTKEEIEKMIIGTKIHEILEIIDFNNPNLDNENIPELIKNKILAFINNIIKPKQIINIYKEYEFKYEVENIMYHGVIDLLIETSDNFQIIDYKLKNIIDENYKNQLIGYKKYITTLTNKPVYTYLYSILDEHLEEIN